MMLVQVLKQDPEAVNGKQGKRAAGNQEPGLGPCLVRDALFWALPPGVGVLWHCIPLASLPSCHLLVP